jgi:hypothetical protein
VTADLYNIKKMGVSDWDKMLPEPDLLGKYFHEQFKIIPDHQRLDFCFVCTK